MKKALLIPLFLCALPMLGQSTTGELRLTVNDATGKSVKATVDLLSHGTQYSQTFVTNQEGGVDAKRLPFGFYQVQIHAPGFARVSEPVEIRSALPLDLTIRLQVATVSESKLGERLSVSGIPSTTNWV